MGADRCDGRALLTTRQEGILCGAALWQRIARAYHPDITIEYRSHDGDRIQKGTVVAAYAGSLDAILRMERVALNFTCHLSGVATLTRLYVDAVAGTRARITDTRKTLPGLRGLQKYAVACGGGLNHRIGLYDAVLVKDNHIAHLKPQELPHALSDMAHKARSLNPPPAFIEVEVDHLEQLRAVLTTPIDIVLLDNMSPDALQRAVQLRNTLAPGVLLEASGGVTLQTVRDIALTGVDRIAIGALTHSAPSLDLGLDTLGSPPGSVPGKCSP
ncbi:MAG: carboxylating nicotinate-nucleotide diphosphorylase [Phycisphaera sp.]|nr:carboxylating nicotinate-nucleotide diphosphorylase [Phycisphaera sp.]